MPQNEAAQAFISRIRALPPGPGVSLDEALKPSVEDETELRRCFASDKGNPRLSDPYAGLVDVFDAPSDIRTIRARVVKDQEDRSAKYVMPLSDADRNAEGTPAMVADLEEFKKHWAVFTEGSLSQLFDWNNVVAAGGSVLACLKPLSEHSKASKRAIRKFYHNAAYPTSDVDLFLWGLTPEQAEAKIITIYEAVRDSVPWDVTCIRTKHTVSIHSQYPYRSVQVILRLYRSPAEILAGFDVDAPCFAYDGKKLWGSPRAIVAMMRQCNTVDMTRRSPSYEVRLAKYASRGFEVYVPDLIREKIDPTIYERSIAKMEGLARLLVFEKLRDSDARHSFLESRRELRGRPNPLARYYHQKRRFKGDLKEENAIGGLEMNDYNVASLHIPYGPGWDARRIDKLVYQTDLGMNSTFNPKNKGRRLHRHPAFFGTMEECLKDCCEHCPQPIDDDEKALQAEESEMYITGRIKFIEENPGRQSMTGSFNPIDVGEWSEQVYVKQTEQFFAAIAANDVQKVKAHLKEEIDLNHRDHVGRTSLHVAIVSGAADVAYELIDAGARISARLADGRSCLHLAVRYDQFGVVKKLLERNAVNREQAKKEEEEKDDDMDEDKTKIPERPSSEDDWSSDENDGKDVEMKDADDEDADDEDDSDEDGSGEDGDDDEGEDNKKGAHSTAPEPPMSTVGDLPEDDEDEPDLVDINDPDWDFGLMPLSYAVLFASPPMIDLLISSGADVTKATHTNHHDANQLHPLMLTSLRENEEEAAMIAERLIAAGASSTTADEYLITIFHNIVYSKKVKVASTILRCDPNARIVVDFPCVRWSDVTFPIVTAIQNQDYAMIALLIAYGAKLDFQEEDITRARDASEAKKRPYLFGYGIKNYVHQAFTPLETAVSKHDDIVQILLSFGAAYNVPLKRSVTTYATSNQRRTIKDWVDRAIEILDEKIEKLDTVVVSGEPEIVLTGWKEHLRELRKPTAKDEEASKEAEQQKKYNQAKELLTSNRTKAYLTDLQRFLDGRSAKGWKELFPEVEVDFPEKEQLKPLKSSTEDAEISCGYTYLANWNCCVAEHEKRAYDELYEACFQGDNDRVQELCVAPKETGSATGEYPPLLDVGVQVTLPENRYRRTGWTPLYAACAGRRWSTAKLIVAIATAQYQPDEKDKEEKVRFSISDIDLGDDDSDGESDGESDDSDDSDMTVEQKKREMKFVDIAAVSSSVKSTLHPRHMISQVNSQVQVGDGHIVNLLGKAVVENDLEAFVNIANLYHNLSDPIDLGEDLLRKILQFDNPKILDEYIRRSGYGLDFEVAKKATAHLAPIVNDENRIYLGLNVHGKKRADLASQNDPNGSYTPNHTEPLVWLAAQMGATKIIAYLATDKPLAAFRFHATAFSDVRAEHLKRTPDLENLFPTWLGWTINTLGESPLTAAILGDSMEVLKVLFAKKPQLLKSALHRTIKFGGHNAFLLAIVKECKPEVLNFLLSKSVSPVEKDSNKGWNAFHYLCSKNRPDLFEYLLNKLPRDVSQALLQQQSKGRLNTPLHLAVKNGVYKTVKILLAFDNSTALYRNVDGQTPLHTACAGGFVETVKVLLNNTPQSGSLFMEDGIGQTPYELASLKELAVRLKIEPRSSLYILTPTDADANPERIDIGRLESELPRLREIAKQLVEEGKPSDPQKFAFEWNVFITSLESKMEEAREALKTLPQEPKKKEESERLSIESHIPAARAATLEVIKEKTKTTPNQRELIKLLDVQQSVNTKLEKIIAESTAQVRHGSDLDAEEEEEKKAWNRSMVYQIIDIKPDVA